MFELIGLSIAFATIVLLVRRKVDFWIAMLAGSLVLGLLIFQPASFLSTVWKGVTDKTTITLAAIILCISVLVHSMKETGQVEGMIGGLRRLAKDSRVVLAGLPSIFGLLPVLGGALLSAPMVEKEGEKVEIDSNRKTFLNFWFRHIWFYIYPLFPGLILASKISEVGIYELVTIQVPMFLAALTVGIFHLRGIRPGDHSTNQRKKGYIEMVNGIIPILVALVLSVLIGLPLLIALIAGIIASLLIGRVRLKRLPKIAKEGLSIDLLLAVVGIMIFRELAKNSGAMESIRSLILTYNIPLFIVGTTIPFLIGLVMGTDIGAIGLSFPIVLPIFPEVTLPLVSLTYISAYLGYLVSPLHLCIVLTCEYFSVDLKDIYPQLLIGTFTIFLTAVLFLGFFLSLS